MDRTLLESKRAALLARSSELTRERDRLATAASEAATAKRELHDLQVMSSRLIPPKRLPVLESIEIATPCSANWEAMQGDETVRFCLSCQKNVYNLSAMTREEAEAFVAAAEDDACVRLYQRADGTILNRDCPTRRRGRVVAAMTVVAGGLAVGIAAASGPAKTPWEPPSCVVPRGGTIAQPPDETRPRVPSPQPPPTDMPPNFRMGGMHRRPDPAR